MHVRTMHDSHPRRDTFDADVLAEASKHLADCMATCLLCADSCLYEDDVAAMRRCIQTDLDCADLCGATLRIISRPGPNGDIWEAALEACIAACEECARECGSHDHDHCRTCAEACRACAEACRNLLAAAD